MKIMKHTLWQVILLVVSAELALKPSTLSALMIVDRGEVTGTEEKEKGALICLGIILQVSVFSKELIFWSKPLGFFLGVENI